MKWAALTTKLANLGSIRKSSLSLTLPPIPLFRITLRRGAPSQNTEQYSDDDEDDKNCRLFLDAVVGTSVVVLFLGNGLRQYTSRTKISQDNEFWREWYSRGRFVVWKIREQQQQPFDS